MCPQFRLPRGARRIASRLATLTLINPRQARLNRWPDRRAHGIAKPKPVLLVRSHQPSASEIHAAAVQRLASISAKATELARAGGMTSHQAAILDGAIYADGRRLASLAPKSI